MMDLPSQVPFIVKLFRNSNAAPRKKLHEFQIAKAFSNTCSDIPVGVILDTRPSGATVSPLLSPIQGDGPDS